MDGKQQKSLSTGFIRIGILILTPVILSLLFLLPSVGTPPGSNPVTFLNQLSCLYVLLLVGIYWMSNILPIAVIALIPIIAYPLHGICKSADAAGFFMTDFNMTATCAVIIMLSFDTCGLRKRLSLKILRHTSCSFRWIYLDVYLATGMLSLWIHSAAATFLMIRVVDDIVACLKEGIPYGTMGQEREVLFQEISALNNQETIANDEKSPEGSNVPPELTELEPATGEGKLPAEQGEMELKHRSTSNIPKVSCSNTFTNQEDVKKYHERNDELLNEFGGELHYVIAVAANICSIVWPHTSPMGAEMFKRSYVMPFDPTHIHPNGTLLTDIPFGISSANLIVYSLPLVLINSTIAIGVLFWITFSSPRIVYKYLGFQGDRLARICPSKEAKAKFLEAIEEKSKEIALWHVSEDVAMLSTIFMIDSVIFRLPVMMEGWSEKFPKIDTGFSVSFAIVVLVLCVVPKVGIIKPFKWASGPNVKPTHGGVLEWKIVQSEFPWSVMLFIGGSSTLGKFTDKALGSFISKGVLKVAGSSARACQIIMVFVMQILILFMSNPGASVATTKIWYRIMKEGIVKGVFPVSAISFILPVMTMGSLCFVSPTQSVPSVMVYELAKKKRLSAWYYLKIGIPLYICTLLPTLGYLFLWKTTDLRFM